MLFIFTRFWMGQTFPHFIQKWPVRFSNTSHTFKYTTKLPFDNNTLVYCSAGNHGSNLQCYRPLTTLNALINCWSYNYNVGITLEWLYFVIFVLKVHECYNNCIYINGDTECYYMYQSNWWIIFFALKTEFTQYYKSQTFCSKPFII